MGWRKDSCSFCLAWIWADLGYGIKSFPQDSSDSGRSGLLFASLRNLRRQRPFWCGWEGFDQVRHRKSEKILSRLKRTSLIGVRSTWSCPWLLQRHFGGWVPTVNKHRSCSHSKTRYFHRNALSRVIPPSAWGGHYYPCAQMRSVKLRGVSDWLEFTQLLRDRTFQSPTAPAQHRYLQTTEDLRRIAKQDKARDS